MRPGCKLFQCKLAKFHDFLDNTSPEYFSIPHLNIRSIKRTIEKFKLFLTSINFTFRIICFTQTWFSLSELYVLLKRGWMI